MTPTVTIPYDEYEGLKYSETALRRAEAVLQNYKSVIKEDPSEGTSVKLEDIVEKAAKHEKLHRDVVDLIKELKILYKEFNVDNLCRIEYPNFSSDIYRSVYHCVYELARKRDQINKIGEIANKHRGRWFVSGDVIKNILSKIYSL
jgi:hypothetical protein